MILSLTARKMNRNATRRFALKVCGVEISGSEAAFAVVTVNDGDLAFIATGTKKLALGDDKDAAGIKAYLQAIKSFAHENNIDAFAIKARAQKGDRRGGAISFKIETLFQLSDCPVLLINPVALSNFGKKNIAGVPGGVLKYQEDAFRCAAYYLQNAGEI